MEVRAGDALETPSADLPEAIGLVLKDRTKSLYPEVPDRLEGRLHPGAFVVADDAAVNPAYLARVGSPGRGYLPTPFAGDVEVSLRLG